MRKLIITSVTLLFFTVSLLPAQVIGLKGGANFGKFVGDDVDEISDELDEQYKFGYQGGIYFAMPIDPLDIRIEALFEQNGAKYQEEIEGIESSISVQLNWIDIPILLGVNAGPLRIFAGPYFDFFLSGKYVWELEGDGVSFDSEEDIESDDLKSFNFGFIAGAAVSLGGGIEIEARYSQGINTLDKEPDDWDGEYEEIDFKPSTIQVSLNIPLIKSKE